MKLISCHDGKLFTLDAARPSRATTQTFRTDIPALDELPPGGAFARGAVHELLSKPGDAKPTFFASVLALHAWTNQNRAVVWSDPHDEFYPPAAAALGIPLDRLFVLRPKDDAEQVWAVAECLRCRGVAAVVATLGARQRLSRVAARQLQLAAERGGGVGLLLRTAGKSSAATADDEHAAQTRWLVQPAPGEPLVQRWRIQLIFGHGGRVGEAIFLEHHRDTADPSKSRIARIEARPVRPAAQLADRPDAAASQRATG
jgi:protein ImuA